MKNEKLEPKRQPWETVEYTENPDLPAIEDLEIVEDFLPRPEDLVFKQPKGMKITITLDPASIQFFKEEAERLRTPYQRMIRNLLAEYAKSQKKGRNQKSIG
jgi:hypothetical protein